MSVFLHISADAPKAHTGGGAVVLQERKALTTLAILQGYRSTDMVCPLPDGWKWDANTQVWDADAYVANWVRAGNCHGVKLAHFYSGTFTETVKELKARGCKVVYTIAAHSVAKSKAAHEELGLPYPYPHLTDPELWHRYSWGYMTSDLIICPSKHSAEVVRDYGYGGPIEIIPHGCEMPKDVPPMPTRWAVGYLGAYGPDKGVVDLIWAWKSLNYRDAVLVLAGRDSTSDWVRGMFQAVGGGSVHFAGWQSTLADYFRKICCHVQPSRSEGFGMEVLESYAYSRPVVCSDHAGACDLVEPSSVYPAGDVNRLAALIHSQRIAWEEGTKPQWAGTQTIQQLASDYTWEIVRQKYIQTWRQLVA